MLIISLACTFHEYPEDISEDGEGGAEDKDGKQECTDGICNFILRLKEQKETALTSE